MSCWQARRLITRSRSHCFGPRLSLHRLHSGPLSSGWQKWVSLTGKSCTVPIHSHLRPSSQYAFSGRVHAAASRRHRHARRGHRRVARGFAGRFGLGISLEAPRSPVVTTRKNYRALLRLATRTPMDSAHASDVPCPVLLKITAPK